VPLPAAQHSSFTDKWPADVVKGLQRLIDAPQNWKADDVAEHFPDRPSEANGRVLEGEIIADLGGGLVIRLIVRRVSGPPLEGEVIFLLHSTFLDRVLVAPVRNERAEATIYAAGWFTVAAIMDGGRTVLTYDLRKLPNAPKWFTEGQSMPETLYAKGSSGS